jgi:hypothetical protein
MRILRHSAVAILALLLFSLPSYGQRIPGPGGRGPAAAGIARVNVTPFEATATSGTIVIGPLSTTAGNTLVVLWAEAQGGSGTATSITDGGDTFTQCCTSGAGATLTSSAGGSSDIWCAANIMGGSVTITVNLNNPVFWRSAFVVELHGANASAPCETGSAGNATGTSVTSGSFSPAGASNYNLAIGIQGTSGTNTWTTGTGYSLVAYSGSVVDSQLEERTSVPSGSQTASVGFTPTNPMGISVVSVKP